MPKAVGPGLVMVAAIALAMTPLGAVSSSTTTVPHVHTSTVTVLSSTITVSSGSWRTVTNTAFHPGEDLQFVVRWGLVTGGRSTLKVAGIQVIDGRPTYHILSEANSSGAVHAFYRVRDRNDVWLDQQSLTTVRYEKHISEGKYRIEESGTFDQIGLRYHTKSYRIDKNRYEEKQGAIAPHTLDVLGSLYYVRTLPMVVGESYTIDVQSSGKMWPLVVKVRKRERIKVPAGKFDCFLVEPLLREPGIFVSKGKKLLVWLTADERRMPVRMRSEVVIGHVSADLVHFTPGTPSAP